MFQILPTFLYTFLTSGLGSDGLIGMLLIQEHVLLE